MNVHHSASQAPACGATRRNTGSFYKQRVAVGNIQQGSGKSDEYLSMKRLHHNTYIAPSCDSVLATSQPTSRKTSLTIANASANSTVTTYLETDTSELTRRTKYKNYQIKSVRKGLPDMLLEDSKRKSSNHAMPSKVLHITDNFICRLSPKRCHSPLAWLFSITVVLICIVIPLLTFSTDVAFYLLGRHPHEETAAFLEKAKIIVENLTATNPVFRQYVLNSKKTENAFARAKELSAIRHSKHRAPSGLRHRHGKREVSPFTYAIPKQAVDEDQMLNTSTSKPFSMTAAVTTKNSTPSCEERDDVLLFMMSNQARKQLHDNHHVITKVFEPVFMIGSIPCLLICMITRFVVLTTGHDDFLSAYFMNAVYMPLQLITGALSVHIASYHVGKLGFECWRCAVDNDCSSIQDEYWMGDVANVMLLVSLTTKAIDGLTGGVMLFLVANRVLQKNRGHASIWWECGRFLVSLGTLVLCLSTSALLLLTPALGMLRFGLFERTSDFEKKEKLSSSITILFVIGVTIWTLSIVALFVFATYKTYIYYRRREHAANAGDHDY